MHQFISGKSIFVVNLAIVLMCCFNACGSYGKAVYEEQISQLDEDEYYAYADIGLENPIFLVSNRIYDEGDCDTAAMRAEVYYKTDDGIVDIGHIESTDTAYPIRSDGEGLYICSNHEVVCYVIEDKQLAIKNHLYDSYSEEKGWSYTYEHDNKVEQLDEDEFYQYFDLYENAHVIEFMKVGSE